MKANWLKKLAVLSICFPIISGCSTVITSAGSSLADQLSRAVASSDDLDTVKDGIPAYMLLLEGMMQDDAENPALLLSSANLYAAYATIFVSDAERQQKMAQKAHDNSLKAACLEDDDFCELKALKYQDFTALIDEVDEDEVDLLFTIGKSWAAHMQASSDDWNQVVHLPKVQYIMEKVIAIDDTIDNGNAHYYLGIIYSLVPPALGGKPQLALKHLEKADEIANKENLMVKVTLAERYARVIFDRELHDKLLKEVLGQNQDFAKYRLINTIAKEKANQLLQSADDFF